MGRSGTSLTTSVLGALGVDVGPADTMLPPDADDNPKGYWEQTAIRRLNDEVLAAFGGEWHRPPALPPGWQTSAELGPLKQRAREIVEEHFPRDRTWAWKDPRTCLTLPFWREVVEPAAYVICVRDPLEVAASLGRRSTDVHPRDESLDLWLRFNCDALRHTGGERRIFVFYDDWFRDPRREVDRICRLLGVAEPSPEVMARIDAILERDLHHHHSNPMSLAEGEDVPSEVTTMYLLLRELGRGGVDDRFRAATERFAEGLWGRRATTLRITVDLAALERRAGDLGDERDRLRAELDRHRAALAESHEELERQRDGLTSVLESRSWRLTRPLRWARRGSRRAPRARGA
jgi:hypothetical protein